MASGDESDLSDEWRVSNSPVVDADGMLVHGVTTTAIMYDWDVTDPATGGNGADGPHDIWVQLRDLAGNWGAVGGKEVVLDRTAPVVTAARAKFLGDPAIAPDIPMSWDAAGADANGCCSGGDVQVTKDGTTWAPFGGEPGAYDVRARLADQAGNMSDWTPAAPVTASERQESSEQIVWSSPWAQHEVDTAYGGGYRSTTRGGSTMKTTVTASSVLVLGTPTKDGGSVRVYLDGVLRGTVRERGSLGDVELLRANFGRVGSHTIKLVAVARAGHRATFDAILTLRQPA
jgi:hypothetical protein